MATKPDDAFVRFQCHGCQLWLKAPPAMAGREQPCPRCQTMLVVPFGETATAAPAHEQSADPREAPGEADSIADSEPDDDEPYEVEAPLEPPSLETLGYSDSLLDETSGGGDEEDRDDSAYAAERVRPTPPRWPFLSGIFTFPFYVSTIVRLVVLSVWASIVLMLAVNGVQAAMLGAVAQFVGMGMIALGLVLGMMWLVAISASLLTVVQQTAHGVDAIEDWPSVAFIDWMLHGFFLVTSTLFSLLPGVAINWVLGTGGLVKFLLMTASGFVLYPIVLLSMLEADSPITPWSPPILASLRKTWWAWAIFYVETAMLLVAVGVLLSFVSMPAGLIMVPVVIALFVYFRLLGRLALCCAQDTAPADTDEHLGQVASDEDDQSEIDD